MTMMQYSGNTALDIQPYGDSAVIIRFGGHISEEVNSRVHAAAACMEERPFPGFVECIPAFTSLTIFYDVYAVSNIKRRFSFCPGQERSDGTSQPYNDRPQRRAPGDGNPRLLRR